MPWNMIGTAVRPAVAAACLLALAGPEAQAAGDGVWRGGADVYARVCQYCHEAGVSAELKGRQLTLDYIAPIVRNGFMAMPSFRTSFIDDKALAALADYLEQSKEGPSDPSPSSPTPGAADGDKPGAQSPQSPAG